MTGPQGSDCGPPQSQGVGGHTCGQGAGGCSRYRGHRPTSFAAMFWVFCGGSIQFSQNTYNKISPMLSKWTWVQALQGRPHCPSPMQLCRSNVNMTQHPHGDFAIIHLFIFPLHSPLALFYSSITYGFHSECIVFHPQTGCMQEILCEVCIHSGM